MIKCYLQTPTPKLEESVTFYSKLNFQLAQHNELTFVSDGKLTICINPSRPARAGLVIHHGNVAQLREVLPPNTPVMDTKGGFICADPSGMHITVLGEAVDLPEFEEQPSDLGNAAGLTIETLDMKLSVAFYQAIGFKVTMGKPSDGWLTMANENGFALSLLRAGMCPHLFFNPSVSFFNGKENNPKVITRLRQLKIALTEEITQFNEEGLVDNVIIRDPGGLGFFIFND